MLKVLFGAFNLSRYLKTLYKVLFFNKAVDRRYIWCYYADIKHEELCSLYYNFIGGTNEDYS